MKPDMRIEVTAHVDGMVHFVVAAHDSSIALIVTPELALDLARGLMREAEIASAGRSTE